MTTLSWVLKVSRVSLSRTETAGRACLVMYEIILSSIPSLLWRYSKTQTSSHSDSSYKSRGLVSPYMLSPAQLAMTSRCVSRQYSKKVTYVPRQYRKKSHQIKGVIIIVVIRSTNNKRDGHCINPPQMLMEINTTKSSSMSMI